MEMPFAKSNPYLIKRFPAAGRMPLQVRLAVRQVQNLAEELYGERFVGMYLGGSHTQGTAIQESDIDIDIVVRAPDKDGYKRWNCRIKPIIDRLKEKGSEFGLDYTIQDYNEILATVREQAGKYKIFHHTNTYQLAAKFFGLAIGKRSYETRREILQAIANGRHAERFWEQVRKEYYYAVLAPHTKKYDLGGETKYRRFAEVLLRSEPSGQPARPLETLMQIRKENLQLPPLWKMCEQHGVPYRRHFWTR